MRYLTKETFKDIVNDSGITKEELVVLKTMLKQEEEDKRTMIVDVETIDCVVYILQEIGIKEEEIIIEYKGDDLSSITINLIRVDYLNRIKSYNIM